MDISTESLDRKMAKLVLYNYQLEINLHYTIPASTKSNIYGGDTVATKDKLLCSQFECNSGSKGKYIIVCIHTFPRAYFLSVLLSEDPSEHTLVELSSILTSSNR